MNEQNLHPHRAIWILSVTAILGVSIWGAYAWRATVDQIAPASEPVQQTAPATTTDRLQLLDSLRSTTTQATTTTGKPPPIDSKTLNSLKAKDSTKASANPKVNDSMLDSLKAH